MCTKAVLNNITASVCAAALELFGDKLNSVILYGSYARGTNDNDSDIDIMLIVDIPPEGISRYRSEVAKIASRLSLESADCVTISVALQDSDTFEQYKQALPFYRSVASEGVVLYAA